MEIFEPIVLPCGSTLKNRIVKSAMSDSLGDGTGHPTVEQIELYKRWAQGGVAASIIGEVQCSGYFAEKPGNLVLNQAIDTQIFKDLAQAGKENNAQLWLQLGHAGALAFEPTSSPKGPSALRLPGLRCDALTIDEIQKLPSIFAQTAASAMNLGFGGVQIHSAHGFLLSQFLSPLFNKRDDDYGGIIANRMRLLLEIITAVRIGVGDAFPIAVKLNSSDLLEGGLNEDEALQVVAALDGSSIDLIEISGGTYFPGAKSVADKAGAGAYFVEFAKRARLVTTKPLMLTGGIKTFQQAQEIILENIADVVGLARALVIEPSLPNLWKINQVLEPAFPRFLENPEGGISAWYTLKIMELIKGGEAAFEGDLAQAIEVYEARDKKRTDIWVQYFNSKI